MAIKRLSSWEIHVGIEFQLHALNFNIFVKTEST